MIIGFRRLAAVVVAMVLGSSMASASDIWTGSSAGR